MTKKRKGVTGTNLLNNKKKKVYRFNLKELENELRSAYASWTEVDNEETRTGLYKAIYDIAFAILNVGTHIKTGTDHEILAYEYALYLFERIITKRFVPDIEGGMPWQKYIDLNIRNIVYSKRDDTAWMDLVEDIEFLVAKTERYDLLENGETMNTRMDKDLMAERLLDSLKIFYTYEEIQRLLPLSSELIYSDSRRLISKNMPDDIRDFSMVIISLAKRLVQRWAVEPNKIPSDDLRKMLSSSVRSSVFLSSIVNSSFFPKELLLALDIDSIYRLVSIAGGKKIRIPTQWELNTLIGAVVASSKMVLEGKTEKESLNESKKDYDLVFSFRINVQNLISKTVKSLEIFDEDKKSDPLVNSIFLSINNVNSLLKRFVTMIEKREFNEESKESYLKLTNTVDELLKSIKTANDSLKKQLK